MRLPEGLPELKGRWLAAYKLLWWAMLAVSLVALTAGQWRDAQATWRIDRQFFGVGLQPEAGDGGLVFGPVGPEAAAAGVAPESVLLAVDGRAVPQAATAGNLDRIARELDGPAGQAITLRLRAPDGTVSNARVLRGPQHLAAADREAPVSYADRRLIELASRTLDARIVMAGAVLLFRRRASDPVAALLSLGLLAVPANDIAFLFADPTLVSFLDSALDMIPMACILLGMTVFPGGRFEPRWTLLIFPAIAAWALLLLAGGGWSVPLALAAVLPGLAIAVGSLIRRYVGMPPGPPRQQVKWVMLGFAAFLACGMLQIGLIFLAGATEDTHAHVAVFVADSVLHVLQGVSIVGGLLVSLLRHRLYDADAAISRSAVYAVLTVTLIAVFAASETLIQSLGQQWFGAGAGVAGGAFAAALAALLLVPLHQRLSRWAERRFQRDLAKLHAELPLLLAEARNSADPREFADNALSLVIRGVHARHGAILLAEDGKLALAHAEGIDTAGLARRLAEELPDHPAPRAIRSDDPVLPLRLPLVTRSGAHTGWIALGPHPDGSFYGKEDRKALEELARPLARAIELAVERARRDAAHDAERRTLTDRLAQLEQQLAQVIGGQPPRPA